MIQRTPFPQSKEMQRENAAHRERVSVWTADLIRATPATGFIGCARAIQKLDFTDQLAFEVGVEDTGDSQEVQVTVTLTIPKQPSPIVKNATIDLIEEVARVYGYNKLPQAAPGGRLDARPGTPARPAHGMRPLPRLLAVTTDALCRAADFGVHLRNEAEGVDHRFHEEGHETELNTVLLLKCFLVLLAQSDHGRHVRLVESSEECCVFLSFYQPLGNAAIAVRQRGEPRRHARAVHGGGSEDRRERLEGRRVRG